MTDLQQRFHACLEYVRTADASAPLATALKLEMYALFKQATEGDVSGNKPGIVDYVETGRTYLDGTTLVGAFDGVVRDRIKLALNGLVIVGVVIDEDDMPLEDVWVELRGLAEIVSRPPTTGEKHNIVVSRVHLIDLIRTRHFRLKQRVFQIAFVRSRREWPF